MTKGMAVVLALGLIIVLGIFVAVATLRGGRLFSPIPEQPKIIWIKPSLTPSPVLTASPSATPVSRTKVLVTEKPAALKASPTPASTSNATTSPTATP